MNKYYNKRSKLEHGQGLMEIMVIVGIILIVSAATLYGIGSPGTYGSTRIAISTAMSDTTSVATSTGNGATLAFIPSGPQGPHLEIYAGRPNGSTLHPMPTIPTRTIPFPEILSAYGQNNVSPGSEFAIFIDDFGRATYGQWKPGLPITPCTISGSPLVIRYGKSEDGQSLILACGGSSFQALEHNGNPIPTITP